MSSPHPKFAAIIALLIALLNGAKAMFDGDPATVPDYATICALAAVCWGLFSARQNNVTSEQAGAK